MTPRHDRRRRCAPGCGRCPSWTPPVCWPAQVKAIRSWRSRSRQPSARADPDGDGLGQDVHGRELAYRLMQVRGRRARAVPRRPGQPRPPDAARSSSSSRRPDDGRKFTELYNVQHLTSNRIDPVGAGRDHDDPAALLDPARRAGARPPTLDEKSRLSRSSPNEPVDVVVQPGHPDRDVRRHHHRRVPPLDLRRVAAGARVLRRLPRRPDRDAGQADVRLLQPEPRHGVRPRRRRSPTASTSTSTCTASAPRSPSRARRSRRALVTKFRDRETRADAAGEARRGRRPTTPASSTATSSPTTRSAPSSARSGTTCSPRSSPAAREVPKTLIFAKDDCHADDIVRIVPRGVRQGQRLRRQDHLPARPGAKPEDLLSRVPQQLQPADRGDGRHDRDRHRRASRSSA